MAATLTGTDELTYLSFGIEKTETTPDGDLLVWGKASDGSLDSDEQIVDPEFSAKGIRDWLASGANVRVQHNAQRDPAGIGVEVETDGDGATWVKSLVVEPVAKRLVEKGALRAYSVGIARPKIVRDAAARGGRIVDGEICEISLVDRPANKNCGIQLVKAADDGHAEWVGKVFGDDVLTKSEEAGSVSLDLPSDVSVSFSPADLAKLLAHKQLAEKRQAEAEVAKRDMDPAVGGGVDRDKIPAEDHVDPQGRRFPIVTPGDVSDAVSSYGRAKPRIPFKQFKRRLTAIAQRKGAAFVKELPQAWKKPDTAKAAEPDAAKRGKQCPDCNTFNPADAKTCSNCGHDLSEPKDTDEAHKTADTTAPAAEPDVAKAGAKTCTKCGKSYHADSKMKRCEGCGTKLPKVHKSATLAGATVSTVGGIDVSSLPPEALKALTELVLAAKSGKPTPIVVEGDGDKDHDGDGLFDADGDGDGAVAVRADSRPKKKGKGMKKATKASKPTPGEGVVGQGAADIEPVPEHREPDGPYIEALEHDASLPTVPDRDVEVKTAMRLKSLGVPSDQGALHDLLCPAYHPTDAVKAHPQARLAGMDVSVWQQKAMDAAYGAPMDEAGKATALWQHAVTIKGTAPDVLHELRTEAHKAFRDANTGPGTFPKPTELSATRFRRPYISAGHAAPSSGQDGPNTAKVPDGHVDAEQFDRGYLQAGHAADSPSNKGQDVIAAPVPAGAPQRTYYTNVQRDSARSAMAAMHDHIAQTFPDLCPMSGAPGTAGEPPIGQRPVPVPSAAVKADGAAQAQRVSKATKKAERMEKQLAKAREDAGLEPAAVAKAAAPALEPELVKAAVTEATAGLAAQLAELTKALKVEQRRNKRLAKAVDALGDQPDPTVAPFRGMAASPAATKSSAPPVGTPSAAEVAERTQLAVMRAMQEQARTSPDPAAREAAWQQLYKMSGLTPQ